MKKIENVISKMEEKDVFLELMSLVYRYKKTSTKANQDKIRDFLRNLEENTEKIEPYVISYLYMSSYILSKAYFIIGELDEFPTMPDQE